MNKSTKQLKNPTDLKAWILNATTVLNDDSITSKDLDKMFKKDNKLDLQCITNKFEGLGNVNNITQYVIESRKLETIRSLKTSNSDEAKQTYEQLSKLKRLYRAKKTLSGAGLRIKWHKEYITKALKLKWSIGKPKNGDNYTNTEINTYAGILGNNLRRLDNEDKDKSEKLPGGSSYTTLEELTDALTNTNPKDKKDVLSDTLNILNAMKEKSDKRRLIGLKGKLKDTNPVYFALFNEKTTKFTYEKIKSSVERITASNNNPSETKTIDTNQSTEKKSTPKKTNETAPKRITASNNNPSKTKTINTNQSTEEKSIPKRPEKEAPTLPTRKTSPKSNKK